MLSTQICITESKVFSASRPSQSTSIATPTSGIYAVHISTQSSTRWMSINYLQLGWLLFFFLLILALVFKHAFSSG